jgi:hypothetical protein
VFQRRCGAGPPHRDHKRKLADQCARADDDLGASAILNAECTALNDKSRVRIIAFIEEQIAPRDIALLGADRQHAQRGRPQQAQCRDALEQGNIIFDRHAEPVIGLDAAVQKFASFPPQVLQENVKRTLRKLLNQNRTEIMD